MEEYTSELAGTEIDMAVKKYLSNAFAIIDDTVPVGVPVYYMGLTLPLLISNL